MKVDALLAVRNLLTADPGSIRKSTFVVVAHASDTRVKMLTKQPGWIWFRAKRIYSSFGN